MHHLRACATTTSADIALGDVNKKQNNVYEHGDIALGRNDAPKANADYGVLPTSGYGILPSNGLKK